MVCLDRCPRVRYSFCSWYSSSAWLSDGDLTISSAAESCAESYSSRERKGLVGYGEGLDGMITDEGRDDACGDESLLDDLSALFSALNSSRSRLRRSTSACVEERSLSARSKDFRCSFRRCPIPG